MRKSEISDDDAFEAVANDDDVDFEQDQYQRSGRKLDIRRGIEDYFERKKLKSLDDWYQDL